MRTAVLLSLVAALAACAAANPAPASDPSSATAAASNPGERVYDEDSVDVKPRPLNTQAIMEAMGREYSTTLRDGPNTGSTLARLLIGSDGQVKDVTIVRTTHREHGPATVRVFRGIRFVPARRNGEPVAVRVLLPVQWSRGGG